MPHSRLLVLVLLLLAALLADSQRRSKSTASTKLPSFARSSTKSSSSSSANVQVTSTKAMAIASSRVDETSKTPIVFTPPASPFTSSLSSSDITSEAPLETTTKVNGSSVDLNCSLGENVSVVNCYWTFIRGADSTDVSYSVTAKHNSPNSTYSVTSETNSENYTFTRYICSNLTIKVVPIETINGGTRRGEAARYQFESAQANLRVQKVSSSSARVLWDAHDLHACYGVYDYSVSWTPVSEGSTEPERDMDGGDQVDPSATSSDEISQSGDGFEDEKNATDKGGKEATGAKPSGGPGSCKGGEMKLDRNASEVLLEGLCDCQNYVIGLRMNATSGGEQLWQHWLPARDIRPAENFTLEATNDTIFASWLPSHSNSCQPYYRISLDNGETAPVYDNLANYTIKDLSPLTTYTVTIESCLSFNGSEKCEAKISQQIATKEGVPTEPMNLTLVSIWYNSSSAKIAWSPPARPNGEIIGYEANWTAVESSASIIFKLKPNETAVDVKGVKQCSTYLFSVFAMTKSGSGRPASLDFFTTSPSIDFTIEPYVRSELISVKVVGKNISLSPLIQFQVCFSAGNVSNFSDCESPQPLTNHFANFSTEPYTPYTIAVKPVRCGAEEVRQNYSVVSVTSSEGVPGIFSVTQTSCKPLNHREVECFFRWTTPTVKGFLKNFLAEFKCINQNFFSVSYNSTTTSASIRLAPRTKCRVSLSAESGGGNRTQNFMLDFGDSCPAPVSDEVLSSLTGNISRHSKDLVNDPTTQVRVVVDENFFLTKGGDNVAYIEVLHTSNLLLRALHNEGRVNGVDTTMQSALTSVCNYSVPKSKFKLDCLIENLSPGTNYTIVLRGFTGACCFRSVAFSVNTLSRNHVMVTLAVLCTLLLCATATASVIYYFYRSGKLVFSKKINDHNGIAMIDLPSNPVQVTKRGIPLVDFARYVDTMHRDVNLLFQSEYNKLCQETSRYPCVVANAEQNRTKNRFKDILPYDFSRVKLHCSEDDSDYINANYVPGYHSRREYIATQGPLAATLEDFWLMIWQQNVRVIVMLTMCVENGRQKCDKYWPNDGQKTTFGSITVTSRSESITADYTIRVFKVSRHGDERTVSHCHFTTWPDRGCPSSQAIMLKFVKEVRYCQPKNQFSPICVHCSAGVGRTGTFISIDRLIEEIEGGRKEIHVYATVMELRSHRCLMVQVEDQYVYIHDCISEYLREKTLASLVLVPHN